MARFDRVPLVVGCWGNIGIINAFLKTCETAVIEGGSHIQRSKPTGSLPF